MAKEKQKTIIEQAEEIIGSKNYIGSYPTPQKYMKEALRLFAEKIEKKSFLKANEELRFINEHIWQQLKKSEGIE